MTKQLDKALADVRKMNRAAWIGIVILCLALLFGPTLLGHLEAWYDGV